MWKHTDYIQSTLNEKAIVAKNYIPSKISGPDLNLKKRYTNKRAKQKGITLSDRRKEQQHFTSQRLGKTDLALQMDVRLQIRALAKG